MEFTITRAAEKKIAELKASQVGSALRICVQGGGCSGFEYVFSLVEKPEAEDLIIEEGEATVIVDVLSSPYLEGAELDFIDTLIESGFKINNPNATSTCGCGTSFSV